MNSLINMHKYISGSFFLRNIYEISHVLFMTPPPVGAAEMKLAKKCGKQVNRFGDSHWTTRLTLPNYPKKKTNTNWFNLIKREM